MRTQARTPATLPRRATRIRARRQSGIVLVVVLVFALLLASSVATFVRRATVDTMIARNRESGGRAESIARGGVRLATILLLDDKLRSNGGAAPPGATRADALGGDAAETTLPPPGMDTRSDLWAQIGATEIPIDDVSTLHIDVRDVGEKLNLNAVFQFGENGEVHDNARPLLEALLEKVIDEMPIPPGEKALYYAPDLAAALIDYVDPDEVPLRGGGEDDVYQRRDPPRRAANRPLLSVDELRVVEGFDPRLVDALRPYVTVYPYAGRFGINPNTAPPHVLKLLFFNDGVDFRLAKEEEIREILRVRQEGGWICGQGSSDEACTPIGDIVQNAIYPPPAFGSNVFTIRSTAKVVGVSRTIEAVIDRKVGAEPLLLSWRVL